MRLPLLAGLLLALLPLAPLAAQNSDDTASAFQADAQTGIEVRADQVVELLNGELEADYSDVFSDAFLNAVSPAQLDSLAAQITSGFGKAVEVSAIDAPDGFQSRLEVRLERGLAKGMIAIDPEQGNKIVGLRFTSLEPINDTIEKIEADLAELSGEVSVYFTRLDDSDPVLSINADKQLAIGSTFKLYVLAALSQDIARGQRKWDDVVSLDVKSFPSGQMQDWPESAPVTLHTLASMMISISDNTATDQLIKVVGHDRLMAMLLASGHSQMDLNSPFLTTRQLFQLKGGPRERVDAYRNGDKVQRSDILAKLESTPVDQEAINAAFADGPFALDIEWFASGADLANLFKHMGTFADETTWDILSINKAITPRAGKGWSYVGYKGGSEPGVLNLTWLLEDISGKHYVLSLGWNNSQATLDNSKLELIAQRILSLPR